MPRGVAVSRCRGVAVSRCRGSRGVCVGVHDREDGPLVNAQCDLQGAMYSWRGARRRARPCTNGKSAHDAAETEFP